MAQVPTIWKRFLLVPIAIRDKWNKNAKNKNYCSPQVHIFLNLHVHIGKIKRTLWHNLNYFPRIVHPQRIVVIWNWNLTINTIDKNRQDTAFFTIILHRNGLLQNSPSASLFISPGFVPYVIWWRRCCCLELFIMDWRRFSYLLGSGGDRSGERQWVIAPHS